MGRSRYEFIKIEQRLFNDHRFYMLSEFEQLTYIKLVSMMKQTKNKIPKDWKTIGLYMRSNRSPTEIKSAIKRIKKVFDNLREDKYNLYFENYDAMYNYSGPANFQKRGVEEEEEEDKDKDKDKEEEEEDIEVHSSFKKSGRLKATKEEVRFSKGRFWVIPKDGGSWLEFTGKQSEIEFY